MSTAVATIGENAAALNASPSAKLACPPPETVSRGLPCSPCGCSRSAGKVIG